MESDPITAHLAVSIPQLLDLIYGSEDFFEERHWLFRNTQASGYCRIVSKELAAAVFALDPGELFTHVQPYNVDNTPVKFYTVWRRQEWRESNERVRITKTYSILRCSIRTQQDDCETIARRAVERIVGTNKELGKQLNTGLLEVARRVNFDIAKFLDYIDSLNKECFAHLDLTTEHQHFLTQPKQNANLCIAQHTEGTDTNTAIIDAVQAPIEPGTSGSAGFGDRQSQLIHEPAQAEPIQDLA